MENYKSELIEILKFLLSYIGIDISTINFNTLLHQQISSSNAMTALNQFAKLNQLRIRQVNLSKNWYKKRPGTLLIFLGEGNTPCVLIDNGHYMSIHGLEEHPLKLDKEIAEKIHLKALLFYKGKTGVKSVKDFLLEVSPRNLLYRFMISTSLIMAYGFILPIANYLLFTNVILFGDQTIYWQMILFVITILISYAGILLLKNHLILNFLLLTNQEGTRWIFDKVLRLPLSFFDKYTASTLALRIELFDEIQETFTLSLLSSMISLFSCIPALLVITYFNPLLALVIGIIIVLLATITFYFSKSILKHLIESQLYRIRVNEFGVQSIKGISKLILSGVKHIAEMRWFSSFKSKKKQDYLAINKFTFLQLWQTSLLCLAFLMFFYVTGSLIDIMPLANLMALLSAFTFIYVSLSSIFQQLFSSLSIVPLLKQLEPIIQHETEEHKIGLTPYTFGGALELNHVNFSYPNSDSNILENVSITINKGESIAIVGPSGSGKSTLLKCILGLQEISSGEILFDRYSLRSLNHSYLRSHCGIILQNTRLIEGTLYENIAVSISISQKEVMEICELLGFANWVRTLPMQLQTIIKSTESGLSSGQEQMILIARALANQPTYLFLDEATSALDNATQKRIVDAINSLNITRILIAHRLSTIEKADCIYVMNEGKIIQSGVFKELLNVPGLFQQMMKKQLPQIH